MSTAVSVEFRIARVDVTDETITAHLVDVRVISVPLAWSWRLSDATPSQRANWELIGDGHGVHGPDVDEDISTRDSVRKWWGRCESFSSRGTMTCSFARPKELGKLSTQRRPNSRCTRQVVRGRNHQKAN